MVLFSCSRFRFVSARDPPPPAAPRKRRSGRRGGRRIQHQRRQRARRTADILEAVVIETTLPRPGAPPNYLRVNGTFYQKCTPPHHPPTTPQHSRPWPSASHCPPAFSPGYLPAEEYLRLHPEEDDLLTASSEDNDDDVLPDFLTCSPYPPRRQRRRRLPNF